jgi:ferredoxin, 2Fe-2S
MPTVTFVHADGTSQHLNILIGHSIMEGARNAGVEGIDADCGGACSCATCHIRIAPEWAWVVGRPGELEDDLLYGASGRNEYSRLSCQIMVSDDIDGIVVEVPAR